jgi:hypothetical protein
MKKEKSKTRRKKKVLLEDGSPIPISEKHQRDLFPDANNCSTPCISKSLVPGK